MACVEITKTQYSCSRPIVWKCYFGIRMNSTCPSLCGAMVQLVRTNATRSNAPRRGWICSAPCLDVLRIYFSSQLCKKHESVSRKLPNLKLKFCSKHTPPSNRKFIMNWSMIPYYICLVECNIKWAWRYFDLHGPMNRSFLRKTISNMQELKNIPSLLVANKLNSWSWNMFLTTIACPGCVILFQNLRVFTACRKSRWLKVMVWSSTYSWMSSRKTNVIMCKIRNIYIYVYIYIYNKRTCFAF